jgi:hypothetical protein
MGVKDAKWAKDNTGGAEYRRVVTEKSMLMTFNRVHAPVT